jgi:hypothetical protein
VRDQTRIVDLKQVNRVLIQPHYLTGGKTVTKRCPDGRAPRWTREQIRTGRVVPLVPLLQKRGLQLIELPAGNFELVALANHSPAMRDLRSVFPEGNEVRERN